MKLIFFRKIALGILSGIVISAAFLLIFALVLSKQEDPKKSFELLSFIALAVSSAAAGKVSTLGIENKLVQALVSALAFSVLVLIASLLFSELNSSSLLKMLLTALLTFTGAMIGKRNHLGVSGTKRRKAVLKRYAR